MTNRQPMPAPVGERLRCQGCAHFFITHDQSFPYGCRAFDFKSRRHPIQEVMEASWTECLYFLPKPEHPKRAG